MHILWTGEKDRPEGAKDYSAKVLKVTHRQSGRKPIVIGNPDGPYDGVPLATRGLWTEVHTEHNIKSVDHKFWATDVIVGAPVGLLSGFGADVSMQMVAASRMRPMPSGASGFSVLFINGPNLNLLGTRQPEIYGKQTLNDIFRGMKSRHPDLEAQIMQSNAEHEIVNVIQNARNRFDAIIINAGAYTHTSVAIHDALKNFDDIIIELHISNPHQREEFRHRSFIAPAAHGLVAGFGAKGYDLALMGVLAKL